MTRHAPLCSRAQGQDSGVSGWPDSPGAKISLQGSNEWDTGTHKHTVFLILIIDLLKFNFCKQFSSPDINEVIHQLTGFFLMGWEEKWDGKKRGPSHLLL